MANPNPWVPAPPAPPETPATPKAAATATKARATFATPLPQSPRSDIMEWRLPRPHSHLMLTGRSRAAWHTSFVIPQLNLLLDAGLCVNNLRPRQIFLTHGHSDHTLLTPAFLSREDPPDIYCPVEMAGALDAYLNAKTILGKGGLVGLENWVSRAGGGGGEDDEDDEDASGDGAEVGPGGRGEGSEGNRKAAKGRNSTNKEKHKRTIGHGLLDTHVTHALRPGDSFPLPRSPAVTATAFACDHTVPSMGYVFSLTSRRLRAEYAGLGPGELKALRASGVEITSPHSTPILAFLGDTTARVLASAPEWLAGTAGAEGGGCAVVITECSFLWEEHRPQAEKTKHTIWGDLEPIVRRWPGTTFVLTHFSLRYSDRD